MHRKIKMGMVGGGKGAFIGAVHRMAAALDGQIELVCGAFSGDPRTSRESGKALFLPPERVYGSYAEMFAAEKRRSEETWRAAESEIKFALRSAFRQLIAHLADRLTPKETGEAKALHRSAIDNLLEFIAAFRDRNVANDSQLDELCHQARGILQGKTVEDLKGNQSAIQQLQGEMTRVTEVLDNLLQTAPKRRIAFED